MRLEWERWILTWIFGQECLGARGHTHLIRRHMRLLNHAQSGFFPFHPFHTAKRMNTEMHLRLLTVPTSRLQSGTPVSKLESKSIRSSTTQMHLRLLSPVQDPTVWTFASMISSHFSFCHTPEQAPLLPRISPCRTHQKTPPTLWVIRVSTSAPRKRMLSH
jgi:hypothetical protein